MQNQRGYQRQSGLDQRFNIHPTEKGDVAHLRPVMGNAVGGHENELRVGPGN